MKNKKALIIAAHPDDEALGLGATWCRLKEEGWELGVVWLTDGVSSRGINENNSMKRRAQHDNALAILKPKYCSHGSFPDNKLDDVPLLEVVKFIEKSIEEFSPNRLYIHSLTDLNIDHKVAHHAAITAARPFPRQVVKEIFSFEVPSSTHWGFNDVFDGRLFVDVSKYFNFKINLLNSYSDELRSEFHARSLYGVEALMRFRGSLVGVEFSEVFEVIRIVE